MNKENTKTTQQLSYERRLKNTKIFASALLRGEIILMKNVNDPKDLGFYVPKKINNSKEEL